MEIRHEQMLPTVDCRFPHLIGPKGPKQRTSRPPIGSGQVTPPHELLAVTQAQPMQQLIHATAAWPVGEERPRKADFIRLITDVVPARPRPASKLSKCIAIVCKPSRLGVSDRESDGEVDPD